MTKDDARDACLDACRECSKYSHEPDIKDCTYITCPLYQTRPQSGVKDPDWKRALRDYQAWLG